MMRELERFTPAFHDYRNSFEGNHNQRTIHYPESAKVMSKYFHGKKMLEAGCGMGWITYYLQELGEDVEGFDIVQYAVDNAITKNIFQADMMDTVNWDKKWDVVFCINSIAYLEEDEIPIALKGLSQIFTDHLLLKIQTWSHFLFRSSGVPPDFIFPVRDMYDGCRRTAQTRDWYLEIMFGLGLEEDYPLYKKIKFDPELISGADFRDRGRFAGLGWKGFDGLFVMKKR